MGGDPDERKLHLLVQPGTAVKIATAPFAFLLAGLIWLLGKAVNAWPEKWQ